MPRILITGVTGFVGSNLVEHFSGLRDYKVTGVSRDKEKALEQFRSYQPEVLDQYSSSDIDRLEIDYVIHLAGIAHDLSSAYKPGDYYRVNDEGTRRVFDEFSKSKASKFIFVSSIKAAVDISSEPVTEDVVPNPVTDYGKSKLKAEQYIQSTSLSPGKSFYILRPCMIHGPGNKGNLNSLYRFVKKGIPFPFGQFENQRSFLSIDNFIFVVQKLMENEINSGVYHLADDGFISTKDLYKSIARALGKRARVWNVPKIWIQFSANVIGRKQLIDKLTENMMVSNKKILKALNIHLPVTLEKGIIKTIRSFDE